MRAPLIAFVAALLVLHGLETLSYAQTPAPTAEPASPPPAQAQAPSPEERRAQARALFESGLGHFDRGEWSAALADFLRSREIFPTRSATKNAAVCLRKEARFDEALDMFEELLRAFTDLSARDRAHPLLRAEFTGIAQ